MRKYSERTLKVLFGLSSHCAYPGCAHPLILPAKGAAEETVLVHICHIIAASDDGPRGDPTMSLKARREPDNLVLMCPTHHSIVDDQHLAYPAPLLREWKSLQQRETTTKLAPYRAAITRYLRGELTDGALVSRRTDEALVEPRLETMQRDTLVASNLGEVVAQLDKPLVVVIG